MQASRILILPLLWTFSCGGADEGSVPSISDLSYSPATVSSGQQSTISGTLAFRDQDADVRQIGIELTLPDGSRQALPLSDVQGSAGLTMGTLTLSLALAPPAPGDYGFEVWIVDGQGHDSNRLGGSVHAQ